MPRQIYLLAFPVSKATKMNGGRAHWAIFVPTIDSSTKGKVIQVTGNPFMGFTLDFKRNYDIENDSRAHHMLTLALIDDKHISDGAIYGDGGSSTDSNALDILEAEAKELDPLGVSVEPLNPLVYKACQDWTREYVLLLIRRGIFPQEASHVLDQAKALESTA